MTPRASFVIPVYNGQAFINQAILSCRNQSVKQIEILVVNDGSSDGTQDAIDFHTEADDRVRGIHLTENQGRSNARNVGNEAAQSEVILVLDADDMASKNRVRDTLTTFELKKPDIVYGPFYEMDEMQNVERKITVGPFNKDMAIKTKLNYICHSTMAYRKGVTRNIAYDTGEYSALGLDDWKFQWDAFIKGYKFAVAKNALSFRRNRQSSISYTRDPKEVERLKESFIAQIP